MCLCKLSEGFRLCFVIPVCHSLQIEKYEKEIYLFQAAGSWGDDAGDGWGDDDF